MQALLLYTGAIIIILWGIGHLFPTKSIVTGFGNLSSDNYKIITMEWIAEGITLCFLGVIIVVFNLVSGVSNSATHLVARVCAGMLIVMAILSAFTGAKTVILPMKLCPFIKSFVALLYIVATLV